MVLGKPDRDANKSAFDYLYARKEDIESKPGIPLNWWRFEGKPSYVDYHIEGIGISDETNWTQMAKFHAEWSKKIYDIFVPLLLQWNGMRESVLRCILVADMLESVRDYRKGGVDMRSQQEVNQIIRQLCTGLKPFFPQGDMEVILFGSYARGDADADSDIDVMILVDSPRQEIAGKTSEISSVAAELLLDSGVMVSPIVENRGYFRQNAGFLPFYRNIVREGVRYSA